MATGIVALVNTSAAVPIGTHPTREVYHLPQYATVTSVVRPPATRTFKGGAWVTQRRDVFRGPLASKVSYRAVPTHYEFLG